MAGTRFSTLLALCALASSALGATWTITVGLRETDGEQGIGFDPTFVQASPGDDIAFTFAMNQYVDPVFVAQHTATQSTLEAPCTQLAGGFDTGVHDTGSVKTNTGETFTVRLNDTSPLYFFCGVGDHCKQGMVFAVNPPNGGIGFAQFLDNAKASTATVYTPGGSSNGGTGGSGSTTPGAGASGTQSDGIAPTNTPGDSASRVVGGGVFAAFAGALAALAM
jgi:plastocyanin